MKEPKITNCQFIKINLPPVTVTPKNARKYISLFNDFSRRLLDEIIDDLSYDGEIYELDNMYVNRDIIPVCLGKDNYDHILNKIIPDVVCYDKCVYLQSESYIGSKEQIIECWNKDKENNKEN